MSDSIEKRKILCAIDFFQQRGARLLPLHDGKTTSKPKSPFIQAWKEKASRLKSVNESWARVTSCFGLVTGEMIDGKGYLTVIDCDIDQDTNGIANFIALAQAQGFKEGLDTFTVDTPSGGKHFWFYSDIPFGNSVSKLAPGVDVRGKNGYVGMPGSHIFKVNTNGPYEETETKIYSFKYDAFLKMKPLPTFIYDFLLSHQNEEIQVEEDTDSTIIPLNEPTRLSINTITECLDEIQAAVKGTRNQTLYTIAQRLFRMSPRYFSRQDIVECCALNAEDCGLKRDEALATIYSAMNSRVATMKVYFSDDPDYEALTGIKPILPYGQRHDIQTMSCSG